MSTNNAVGVIIDTDLDTFKENMIPRPVGECLSMRNLLTLEYNRVKSAFNELTDKAVAEGKQNDPEYVKTLQGMNVIMFKLEQKVLFLNDRIEDLRVN